MEPDDLDRAAALLHAAYRTGDRLQALPPDLRPKTIDDGYEIQDRFVARLGDAVVGWKLGAGSLRGRRTTGLDCSIAGRVLQSRLFGPGDVVPLIDAAPVAIEFEMAFVVGRAVEPGDDLDDLDAWIAETRLTCEFVRSRFVDRRAVGWPSFAADDAGFDALVVGPPLDRHAIDEVMRTLVVEVDGIERVRAAEGDDVTDPVGAFRGFLALAARRCMTVPAGAIVSTGTMSVPFDLVGGAAIEGRCSTAALAFTTRLRDAR